MGNQSRRRRRVTSPSVKAPPRAPNWIFTGRDRGYDFINLDRIADARADFEDGKVRIRFSDLSEDGYFDTFTGRPAEDMIAHLVMVGIDITGAAEVLRQRQQDIRETLETLYVLEDTQLEPFHRGEIGIGSGDDEPERFDGEGGGEAAHTPTSATPPISLEELARDLEEEREPAFKGTKCLECVKVDKTSCTWSNSAGLCPSYERKPSLKSDSDRVFYRTGPADGTTAEIPKALEVLAGAADIVGTSADRANCWYGEECHRFPRCLGCSLRNLRDRTSPANAAEVLEVTGKTYKEIIEKIRTCGVFQGLKQRGALFGQENCNVGHEMREPACALCEYLRNFSSDLAPSHHPDDLAGGRAGGAGGESDRDR